jgi:hypothetical protein
MNTPDLLAISLTALCVIVYRVAWAGSSVAAMGRAKLVEPRRNWLLGDHRNTIAWH